MKKIITMIMAVLMFSSIVLADNPGAIWTTRDDCGDEKQDVNHYAIGETVYINGANFNEGEYIWSITGQPGQASCDPGYTVVSDTLVADHTGAFCFAAYIVQPDDCGEYKAKVGNKQDNYRVKGEDEEEIPEFSTIGAGLALLGAGLYASRKRKKN